MTDVASRSAAIAAGYATEGAAVELGSVVLGGAADPSARVRLPSPSPQAQWRARS